MGVGGPGTGQDAVGGWWGGGGGGPSDEVEFIEKFYFDVYIYRKKEFFILKTKKTTKNYKKKEDKKESKRDRTEVGKTNGPPSPVGLRGRSHSGGHSTGEDGAGAPDLARFWGQGVEGTSAGEGPLLGPSPTPWGEPSFVFLSLS